MFNFATKFFNKNFGNSHRYKAFTLAEVLITLGIIGVVAAMTIPTLINNANNRELKTKWKKVYSIINQAQYTIMKENGGDLNLGFDSIEQTPTGGNNFAKGWAPYLKSNKQCSSGKAISEGCYSGEIKALTDSFTITDYASHYCVSSIVLQDGVILFFYPGVCSGHFCSDSNIFIDVNGSKLPNRLGKDVFRVAYSLQKKMFYPIIFTSPACDNAGTNCSQYYLLN